MDNTDTPPAQTDGQSRTGYYPPDTISVTGTTADPTLAGLRRYMTILRAVTEEDHGFATGTIHEPLAENIRGIKEHLSSLGRVALLRDNPEPDAPHVVHFGPPSPAAGASRPWINVVLFLLTVFSTLLIGSLQQNGNAFFLRDLANDPMVQANYWRILWHSLASANPLNLGELLRGVPFSFTLLLILGSHELGHYVAARRYGVDATLPYFLPIPNPLMGTMGAFIRIKSPIPNRRALIRLGVAGPIVGFIFAVPMVIIGLLRSKVVPTDVLNNGVSLGSSLLFSGLSSLFFPNLPPGHDVLLHPLAFAGWLGLFVTALNLIPIGQLDGGHVAYVALGRFRRWFQIAVLAAMVGLGFFWSGWFFWGVLVLILGLDHPPTQDEITPLRTSDKLLMLAAVIIFILTFIPAPFPQGGQ